LTKPLPEQSGKALVTVVTAAHERETRITDPQQLLGALPDERETMTLDQLRCHDPLDKTPPIEGHELARVESDHPAHRGRRQATVGP
jgi:hypothetical protein